MNKTIILNQLSETVSQLTGSEVSEAEMFLREVSDLVAEHLDNDGQVEVPGLGTFVVADETVAFAPDAELAEELNAPFAAFEAVELPDEEPEADDTAGVEIAAAAEFEQQEMAAEPEAEPEAEPQQEPKPIIIPAYRPAPKPDNIMPEAPTPAPEPTPRKRPLTWPWWLIACIVCFIGGYMLGQYQSGSDVAEHVVEAPEEEPVEHEEAFDADTIAVEEPVVHYRHVTDTVTSLKFLTTMARIHYGHTDFWPYIYEANADKLSHPERLAAGTVLVIPPADSLQLNPQDADQLKLAREKAAAIYARFNGQ